MCYYNRQGKEITLFEWSELIETPEYNIIKQEHIGSYFISTVWIGVKSNNKGDPLIFETMIFEGEEVAFNFQERSSTEEEALKQHKDACNFVSHQMVGS